MRRKILSFNLMEEYIGTKEEYISDNKKDLKKMSAAVHFALENELTDRQKTCIDLYYFKNYKIPDIAKMLDINKSTVSRHLAKGRFAIKKTVEYCNLFSKK